ncbi:MAG: copper-binding protein [Thaumarchaeota archaeon S13]|nr:MAG: copper-binding protein [Thaumarchaeota archaeon S13]
MGRARRQLYNATRRARARLASPQDAYGIGVITVIVALVAGAVFYQEFYLPESSARPSVDEHILHPTGATVIDMIPGSANQEQADNFVPRLVNIQLGIDNDVTWTNSDDTAHTVTPDDPTADSYSGPFGSIGVVKPGEDYTFLFTEPREIEYHCHPHPWMTGKVIITKQRF